jgi:hypothetical protein
MLVHSAAPTAFWAEALATATHLVNRRRCRATGQVTPFELLFGVPPDYSELRVFGCLCYPNLSATAPNKLAPRSVACTFIGYPSDHRGYRCFDLESRHVYTSRHVVFDEQMFPFRRSTSTPPVPPTADDDDDPPPPVPAVLATAPGRATQPGPAPPPRTTRSAGPTSTPRTHDAALQSPVSTTRTPVHAAVPPSPSPTATRTPRVPGDSAPHAPSPSPRLHPPPCRRPRCMRRPRLHLPRLQPDHQPRIRQGPISSTRTHARPHSLLKTCSHATA